MALPSAAALCMVAGGSFAAGQVEPKKDAAEHPLWALLETRIDSRTLKVGDAVRAKVMQLWTSQHCMVLAGTEMQGKIESLELGSAAGKSVSMTIHFAVPCVEGQTATAHLVALLYARSSGSKGQMDTYMDMPMGIGTGATGRQSMDVAALPSPMGEGPAVKQPTIKVGEVRGVGHVLLQVPAQAGDSVVTDSGGRLQLQRGTRMAFWLEAVKN